MRWWERKRKPTVRCMRCDLPIQDFYTWEDYPFLYRTNPLHEECWSELKFNLAEAHNVAFAHFRKEWESKVPEGWVLVYEDDLNSLIGGFTLERVRRR